MYIMQRQCFPSTFNFAKILSGCLWLAFISPSHVAKEKISSNYFSRINGGTSFKLNGSCKIHGNSKDSVNADPTQKVFIFPPE